jgi:hypothetical protein
MSARCPFKVVLTPDLPYTEDQDHFPAARTTSLLTEKVLLHLSRRAWGRHCHSKKGREERLKMMNLLLVVSPETKDALVRGMGEPERRALVEGLIAGHQVILCDRMARNDFINGAWCDRSTLPLEDPTYENAEFEDSLILSPDGKTPLVAIRHNRCVIMDLVCCTES